MKNILSTAAIALAFAVSVSAQATPPTPSTTPTTDQKTSKAHTMGSAASKSVTLTGCLREGDTPNSFQLENAEMSKATELSGTSGTSTGMAAAMAGNDVREVKLVATADISLKEHVGHQVEVTGTLSGMGRGMMKDNATGTSGTDKDKDKDKNARTLTVRSFKHVSETCSK